MDSKNFIIQNLRELHSSLPYLEIRYEYRSNITTHLVEVKPVYCYDKDRPYILKQIEIESKFEDLFPNEEVLFMSENVLIQIENPILELGVCFDEKKSHDITVSSAIFVKESSNNFIEKLFETISKVNFDSPVCNYINYSMENQLISTINKCSNEILTNYYIHEPPSSYEVVTNKNTNTKKDSEIKQSLFFL